MLYLGENSLKAVYQQMKMVEKEIQFLLDQMEMFDLFPLLKPKDYIDPATGSPDDSWFYPCKVIINIYLSAKYYFIFIVIIEKSRKWRINRM